jgi:ABC-2 type transport system ATP-binding protein
MVVAVELSHVHKRFGSLQALDDVSLNVAEGEVLALLGPNGAGKTTAIALMLGLRRPSAGAVRIFGLEARNRRARSLRGVMLQDTGVPPALTVGELVDLFRACYPSPLPTQMVLETVGLGDRAGSLVGKLSGGQRQRLHFALAICGDPCALFLDEPTVGLDVEARRGLWTYVREFACRGRTVVLTTHYLEEADLLADRVAVINGGRLIALGTPSSIKAHLPAKRVSYRLGDERVQVHSREPEALLRSLFERRLEIHDLEVEGARLEEAVVDLTQMEPAHA